MAKNRIRSARLSSRRNVRNIASSKLHRPSLELRAHAILNSLLAAKRQRSQILSELSDRRRHGRSFVKDFVPIRNLYGTTPKIRSRISFKPLSRAVRHDIPKSTLVCVRRNRRREVMFANKKAGSRGRQKKPRYNETSQLVCRRRK